MPGPLEGMRVLDLTTGVAGPYASKLLADHGADVVKVEPPGGDPTRAQPPFFHDEPHPDGSLRFLHLNTAKRSIALDLGRDEDRATLRTLVPGYDAVLEDQAPGELATHGLGYADLDALRPGILLTSITSWGQTGPYVGYRQSDIVAQAMGGPMLLTGAPDREPLKLGGALAHLQAGAVAALATTLGFLRQERTGEGDHIDVSIYETQAGSRDRSAPSLATQSYNGVEGKRRTSGASVASGIRPTADGYINLLAFGRDRMRAFLAMIGRADLTDDPRVYATFGMMPPELGEEIEAAYLGWLMQRGKREAVEEAQRHRILAAPINTPADLLADPHYRERGVWEKVDHPRTGAAEYPGRPFVLSASPRPHTRRAPLLDEHRAEVLAEIDAAPRRSPPPAESSRGRLPLEGVRVIDITVVWAGPYATQLLAEWGAEVVRVEPVTRIQPATRPGEQRTTREEQLMLANLGVGALGGFPDHEPGLRPWDRNSSFNSHARNKRSMTADISTEEGRELFYRLVAQSDVLVENNVPETIEKAHATYEELRRIKPDLIMLRMPGFGLSGPYKNYRALGTHIEGMIGHHHIRSYPDATPDEAGDVYTGDAVAGIQGALAVAMALRHRQRTGEGQQIELAQAENFLPMLGEQILEWTFNGVDPGPQGNRHRAHAPHQAYPCAGVDEWIAIDVADDAEFARLCDVLGAPGLASDPRFATAAARLEQLVALDAAVGEQTRRFDKWWLFHRLQAADVTAGPLQTAAEKFHCPQLQARGFFEYLDHPHAGRHWYPGLIWKMARTPNQLRRHAVTLGQDNAYIYREVLGLSEEEYRRHVASGQIGDTYPASVLGYTPGS